MIIIRLHIRNLVEFDPIFRVDRKLLAIYAFIVINCYRVYRTEEIRNDMFYTISAYVFVLEELFMYLQGCNIIICMYLYPLVSVIPLYWVFHLFFLHMYAFLFCCFEVDLYFRVKLLILKFTLINIHTRWISSKLTL